MRGQPTVCAVSGSCSALPDFYRRVTVVERDELPRDAENRKGVPQGRHVHGLAAGGGPILEELFPGLLDDLVAAGGPVVRNLSEMCLSPSGGRFLCQEDMAWDPPAYHATRPFLERHVRDRVRALAGVEFRERSEVVGLATSADQARVIGARIVPLGDGSPDQVLEADLVVDATGRGGRLPTWLDAMGYPGPAEEQLAVQLKYVTQQLRTTLGGFGTEKLLIIGPAPGRPTGLALMLCEDDQVMLTAFGYGGHHPPTGKAC